MSSSSIPHSAPLSQLLDAPEPDGDGLCTHTYTDDRGTTRQCSDLNHHDGWASDHEYEPLANHLTPEQLGQAARHDAEQRQKALERENRVTQLTQQLNRDFDAFLEAQQTPNTPTPRVTQLREALLTSARLDNIPTPKPLIGDTLFLDSLSWVQGKPGKGKSFVALDWAGCVATGTPWHGRNTTQGTVLYLIAEGATGIRQRVRAWEHHHKREMGNVHFLPVAVQLIDHADKAALLVLVNELQPHMVVIDTQARVTLGADENSATDMGMLVAAADEIRAATNACVLMVHHEKRTGDNMRGSTALEGAATTIVRVTKDGPAVRLDCVKQKDSPEFPPIMLRMESRGESAILTSGSKATLTTPSEQAILDAMWELFGSNGASTSALKQASELAETTFYRALKSLASKGLLVNVGEGRRPHYALPKDQDAG